MKILNFIPLLVWGLGFYIVASWDNHRMITLGMKESVKESADSVAWIYITGLVSFLIIGIALSQ